MKFNFQSAASERARRRQSAFTLAEVLVGVGITGVAFTALYSGMVFGVSAVQSTDQSLRATQVMVEKLDTIRLYAWDKVLTPGFIPNRFTVPYTPIDSGLAAKGYTGGGLVYYGTTTIRTNLSGFSDTYRTNLCAVDINIVWTNGTRARSASMTTLVAKNGLQNYVY